MRSIRGISLLVLVLFLSLMIIVPISAEDVVTNVGTKVYIEPTLAVSKTITIPTTAPTTVATPAPTPVPTAEPTEVITEVIPEITFTPKPEITITPIQTITTPAEEVFGRVKPGMWKDTTPKISKNKLTFSAVSVQQVRVMNADDKNVTLSIQTPVNNQIDLPVDISKPGRIAVKMQVGDVVYVIRREV